METRAEAIQAIRALPAQLREIVQGLSAEQLNTAYNAPEWTIAQNIHHLADTHMVCIRRFKLILTSPRFQFTSYDVNALAEMPDAKKRRHRAFAEAAGRLAGALGNSAGKPE